MSHAHKLRHKAILKKAHDRHETDAANFSARLAPACADRDRDVSHFFRRGEAHEMHARNIPSTIRLRCCDRKV